MTSLHRVLPVLLLGSLALVSAGCDEPDEPDEQDYDDVAVAMSSLVASEEGEAAAMEDAIELSTGEVPGGMQTAEDGTVHGAHGSLHYSYSIACANASGQALASCDETTDTADVEVAWDGSLSTSRYDTEVSREGTWSLAGLQSSHVTFEGSAGFELSSDFMALHREVERSLDLELRARYEGVELEPHTGRLEGTITYEIDAERFAQRGDSRAEASFRVDAELTFLGDGTARLVLDGERSYRLELDSGELELESAG
ncbi:MAG: hypothetical protein H6712_02390 [Myxococcales bacterium]|nr:hypothetical protein [Myxococcales bacterium]MCB9712677.1 hypothetical protein [Myxococcales bacterium]